MKENIIFDFNRIPEGTKFNTRLMVNLTADTNTKEVGKPLNVAVVLDRSGSMNGEPLHYVKMATKVLANQLNPDDRFSLTMYDSSIDTLIKPTLMQDIRSLDAVIDTIDAGGMTFLSGGYEKGCQDAKEYVSKDTITRVMLLTDGLANEGITNPDQLAQLASNQKKNGITTSTIGVGEGYDEFLLGRMAEYGGGSTYFIEDPDNAPSVFKEELGYLKSMAASQVSLTFKPKEQGLTFEQLNTYKKNTDESYSLGDFFSGQSKSILFEMALPPMPLGENTYIGDVEITYRSTTGDEITDESISMPITIDVVSEKIFQNEVPNKDVTLEAAFLLVARAKAKSITLADNGKYDDAAEILDNYASLISNLNLDNEQLNNEVADLRSRAQNMRQFKDDFYTVREKKRMFYESDKMAKSEMISYQKMKGRRKD
jgi:Ca-activated chloride channel family protein